MQVTNATVRFSRTIQVREYEPASAEVTLTVQLSDGEDASKAAAECFKISSEQVHLALGLPSDTKLPKRTTNTKAKDATPAAATVTETTKAAAPATKPAATPAAASSDIPDGNPPSTTQAGKSAAVSDIPEATPTTAAKPAEATASAQTPAELSKWIGDQVKNGKTTSAKVQALYPKFGITRFADLKPEKVAEAKAEIEKLIAEDEVL